MRQARAVIIAFVVDKNLGLVFQAAEGGGVQNAFPVPLETSAEVRFFFRVDAAFRVFTVHGVGRQSLIFGFFQLLPGVNHRSLSVSALKRIALPPL